MRLDNFVANIVGSRNRAKELIKSGAVKVENKIVKKPAYEINNQKVEILKKSYVSRAALKLKNYLQKYNIDFKEKNVLDVGASAGGFSEVSLEFGAKKVVAVDVGVGQLNDSLKDKIEWYEGVDIREFKYNEKFDVIVSDVSFISLLKIINVLNELAKDELILLFKPQFEVGKDVKRNKKGVVLDTKAIRSARENFEKECKKLGWRLIRSEESSIKGKEGNTEYIYHFKKEKIE